MQFRILHSNLVTVKSMIGKDQYIITSIITVNTCQMACSNTKNKCCKKYRKKGKSNCRRCPKI